MPTLKQENRVLRPGEDGIPTGPEVTALLAAFPELLPGTCVTYESIEAVIQTAYGTRRFETVMRAWRRALLDLGTVTKCIPSEGIRIPYPEDVACETPEIIDKATRTLRRHGKDLSVLKPTNDQVSAQIQHSRLEVAGGIKDLGARRKSALLPAPATQPLPSKAMIGAGNTEWGK